MSRQLEPVALRLGLARLDAVADRLERQRAGSSGGTSCTPGKRRGGSRCPCAPSRPSRRRGAASAGATRRRGGRRDRRRRAGREQAEDGPRGLRRRCSGPGPSRRDRVGAAALAPAAVAVLDGAEPGGGLLDPALAHVDADRAEADQDLPRAVEIVHAPAAEPRAVGLLRLLEELDGAGHEPLVLVRAVVAVELDDAARQVRGARVEQRVVVRPRQVLEDLEVDVAVERAPAAVGVLHRVEPLHRGGVAGSSRRPRRGAP
jgi:hypothetical protein